MADGVPPVGLGLPFFQTKMDHRVDFADFTMDQTLTSPSFATYTSTLTSSVASSSSLPHQYLQARHMRRDGLNDDILLSDSPRPVSASFVVDAALVAGSISMLIGAGCIIGFICHKRKRRGSANSTFKSRKMKAPWKANNDYGDVEASTESLIQSSGTGINEYQISGVVHDSKFNRLSTSAQFGSNYPRLSTSKTTSLFMAPMTMHDNHTPSTTSTLCPSLDTSDDSLSLCSELKSPTVDVESLNGIDEGDLGSVVLSSLQINESFTTVESRDDHFATSRSDFPSTKNLTSLQGFLTASSSNLSISVSMDAVSEDATWSATLSTQHSSLALSFASQSLVTPDSLILSTIQSLAIPDSPTLSTTHSPCSAVSALQSDSDLTFKSDSAEYINVPLKLLELKIDSELDLHSCLGLDRQYGEVVATSEYGSTDPDSSKIPELVTTDSQDTVTGTDESYDPNSLVTSSTFSYCYESLQKYENHLKPTDPGHHYSAELIIPVTSFLLRPISASHQANTVSVVTDNQSQARTLSPSPSFASSSTSVATLRLPSYCGTEQTTLIEEVLPPPSIIVSVPTDGSLILESYGSTQFSIMNLATATEEQRVRGNRTKRCGVDAAKVIYDPLDEVEEEAWGDAYERTCYMEVSESQSALEMEESYQGLSENWMASSESSELDIGKAITKFPLPPI